MNVSRVSVCGGSPVLLELVKLDAVASGTAGIMPSLRTVKGFTYMTCFGEGMNVSNQPGQQSI